MHTTSYVCPALNINESRHYVKNIFIECDKSPGFYLFARVTFHAHARMEQLSPSRFASVYSVQQKVDCILWLAAFKLHICVQR
jgi:hypothetical protein